MEVNPWIAHIKAYAQEHNLSFRDALKHEGCRSSYIPKNPTKEKLTETPTANPIETQTLKPIETQILKPIEPQTEKPKKQPRKKTTKL